MRLAPLKGMQPGSILARCIYDEKGTVLLGKGVSLSEYLIRRLQAKGISAVYIEDPLTDDILVEDIITEDSRREAMLLVRSSLTQLTVSENTPRHVQSLRIGRKLQQFMGQILSELRTRKNLIVNLANIYAADEYLFHHSVNVSLLAISMAIRMGMEEQQIIDLGIGSMLHDVGKLKIPETILNKRGALDAEEFEIVKSHTTFGYEILRRQEDISFPAAHVAYQHHERVDGSGYPRGLKDKEIHIFGKIVAVADVYEAVTASRPYHAARLPHEGFEFILGGGGTYFDPKVVRAFVSSVAIYPLGLTLKLSTGEEAVVCEIPPLYPQRPRVRVIRDKQGRPLREPYEIELMEHLTTAIVSYKI